MDGRIAHLRSHYRMVGAQVAAPGTASRLDRVLREAVVRNYDEALESALAGDESVYVVRRVKARMSLTLSAEATDTALANSWGSSLAAAVMRAIARGEDERGNLVRFENQADYVASFLVALVKGTHHGQWFYEAFKDFATLETKTAIRRILIDNTAHLPAILAYVHRSGELDSLLAALDTETKQALWSPEVEQRDDEEVSRSLFTAALQFLKQLGIWVRTPRNVDDLFQNYRNTAPPFADWRDPRSLAGSVFEVVRFFFVRGYLSPSSQPSAAELSLRVSKALEEFEWLDREWLKSSVLSLLLRIDLATPDLPLRVSNGRATPRQRELLTAIAGVLGDGRMLGSVEVDPLSAALKVLALLVDAAPGWTDDTAAKVMIENLLTARAAMQGATSRAEFVKCLQCRDIEGAIRLLPLAQREHVRGACRTVSSLGEPALALIEKLTGADEAQPLSGGVESGCAGLSLLLRTMFDARLHTLTEEAGYPATSEWPRPAMLFLLIALRLSGESAFVNGRLEEGLRLLAGMNQEPDIDAIRACWSKSEVLDHASFQKALLDIVAGQRLLEPETMHVFQLDWVKDGRAVIAADESETIFPLGRLINVHEDVASVVNDWQAAWEAATGVTPRVVIDDCAQSRNTFLTNLKALNQGHTGNPHLDLTTSIVTGLLLRIWARWLRGFSDSSVAFLIENFIRRDGRLYAQSDALLIELERRPLDMVMEMAGYMSDLERVSWLPGCHIKFSLKGA